MTFEHDDDSMNCNNVRIKVLGVGGGGNNAVNHMICANISGVEFVSINTDRQALRKSEAPNQLVIGEKITKGFGAGANPAIGARAAEESIEDIRAELEGVDMAFITAGMGGGTGTGAAPVVARVARELDILTVGVVTKPFSFEGKRRMEQAEGGIADLAQYVDSLIIIPNDRLNQFSKTKITLANAFSMADDVLRQSVQNVSDLIVHPATINLDFEDVKSVMKNTGYCHMGMGIGTGKDKAEDAARAAISSPLLETSIKGAKGLIISIICSNDVGLTEIYQAANMIQEEADPDANIIFGANIDNNMEDEMRISLIATGFEKKPETTFGKENAGAATNPNPAIRRENVPTAGNAPQRVLVRRRADAPAQAPATQETEKKPVEQPQQKKNNFGQVGSLDDSDIFGSFN